MVDFVGALVGMINFWPLFFIGFGTAAGIIFGSVPGLTGAMLIALCLPLTFYMDTTNALVLLVAMYVGSISGGLITATLFRMPGTPASVMTTFDGYPMAKGGNPGRALGLGIGASFVGGIISWFFLVLLTEPLSDLAIKFGPFEYFALVMMAMVLIAAVSKGEFLVGLLSGFLGMLVAMPGYDKSTGSLRLTFGFDELAAGLSLLPVLMGVFAVSQIINEIIDIEVVGKRISMKGQRVVMTFRDLKIQFVNMFRSSLIGTWVGILPGIGANIGSIIAYSTAKNLSKTPEKFGAGSEEGIVASESANNATVGGALIPLLSMGIPGSIIDTFLLGALIVHGLQPGPLLFINNPDIVYAMMIGFFIANVFMLLMMTWAVRHIAKLMHAPKGYVLPLILFFCILGAFALNNRIF
ncbi:tripartite tricarboxylate transporter permease, partial [Gimesia sp.]|uniref:tripartite tricarboxylate transporter permease n=1 Tax=Gimesia sp. TaxID=2024833 RepID=UPI003A93E99C